ncbi:MAG: hypothetical protein K9K93_03910 [Acholeplasmataceae bacterium]|nr:hypothetical protein [Acholeplasmataceae bacterium]
MRRTMFKIILTLIIIGAGTAAVVLMQKDNRSETSGTMTIEIVDDDGTVLFDGIVPFEEGDTFFDVLQRQFDLTCATADYKPDPSCDVVTFFGIGYTGRVILGIAGDDFSLSTDWTHAFLAFLIHDEHDYMLATNGVSQIPFGEGSRIRIEKRSTESRESS